MAILTVSIQEEVTIEGKNFNVTNTHEFAADEVIHRIVDLTATETSLVLFDTIDAAGTIKDAQLSYLRITNLHTSDAITLRIGNASEEYGVRVVAGGSYILTLDKMDAHDNIAASGEATLSLAQIDSIKGASSGSTVQVEIFATH
tara:strand:- start:102 stop:536 length:435 start_codon:yes stop_codon:yes gene_type:complete